MSISSPSRVLAYDSITQPFQAAFDQLATFLEDQVEHFEPEVRDLVRYCFGHSGKKLRPLLVFSAANYAGRDGWSGSILKAAAIVELVHLATLVHDDILDEATLRHRTETVASRYGAHVAVLLGDALFAHALHLASEYPSVEVCRSVSRATRQVCSGEIAQTFARESVIPDRAKYFRMIDLKTAELFRVYSWPGNVRQLENAVRRLSLTSRAEEITRAEVEAVLGNQPETGPVLRGSDNEKLGASVERHLRRYFDLHGTMLPPPGLHGRIVREVEAPLIEIALEATGGNQAKCADLLGINRNTLRKKINELNIRVTRRRKLM